VFLDRTYTYREFGEAVNRAAHALAGQRLRRVDRMLLMSGNSDGYVIAFYAAMKLGALPRKIPKHVLRTDLRQAPEAPNV